jgi:hypothetical protein
MAQRGPHEAVAEPVTTVVRQDVHNGEPPERGLVADDPSEADLGSLAVEAEVQGACNNRID